MTLQEILAGYLRIQRRSEKASPEVLRKTFVDVGPLIVLLSITDNQALFGRRGTGKTHVLQYLASKRKDEGDLATYIDLSNLGSSGSIYADTRRTVSERATRLLADTLIALHDALLEAVLQDSDGFDLSIFGPLLDNLAQAATRVQVTGNVEEESSVGLASTSGDELKLGVGLSAKPNLALSASATETRKEEIGIRTKVSGTQSYVLHFGEISAAIQAIERQLNGRRLWVLLDEWSNLPIDLQPYLADLIRRTLFVLKGVTVKIAAIEYRSDFAIKLPQGRYIGIELGADVTTDANLDDFMVFDNDVTKSGQFHRQLLWNHIKEGTELASDDVVDPNELIRRSFSQENVFTELVRAGEGVPRDFINILSLATQYSNGEKITMNAVRKAALNWYQTGKANTLRAREDANRLLEWVIEKVIKHRRTRAFLVKSQQSYPLLEELFDARVVHVIKRRVSSNDRPGERFDVFKLDYGCYVDVIGTASAPKGLFEADTDEGENTMVDVPKDDYRSIRRAILDFEEFSKASSKRSDAAANEVLR
jgi:hypothetical protein